MRNFFTFLTIGLIVIGFIMPLAWIAAFFTAALAIFSRPSGYRVDGKRRTRGPLGGIWDRSVIATTMTDCPYCKTKIKKAAKKCAHCGEWVSNIPALPGGPTPASQTKELNLQYTIFDRLEEIPPNTWYQRSHWNNKQFVNYKYTIPKGWKKLAIDVPVAGISRDSRGHDLFLIAQTNDFKLNLESEPDNPKDPFALKIIASGTLSNGRHINKQVGYIPAEMANEYHGVPLRVLPSSLFLPPSPDIDPGAKVTLITKDEVESLDKTVDSLINELSKK